MNPTALRRSLVTALLLLLAPLTSHAQLFRTYLSAGGSDTNPCTVAAPCRLLPAALTAVADGGEVWMLDSANYNTGPVAVTKSVTVVAVPGVLGSLVAVGGNALNVATAGVKLALRNVSMRPFPGSASFRAIEMIAGTSLTLDECSIGGFTTGYGALVAAVVQVSLSNTSVRDNQIGLALGSGATVRISDSHFTGNSDSGVHVQVGPSDPVTSVAITRTVLSNNGTAAAVLAPTAGGAARLMVTDSLLESNATGIDVFSVIGATADASASGNMISRNTSGVVASGNGARAILNGNSVVLNTTGLAQSASGAIETAGDNTVRGNTTNVSGSTTGFTRL